MAKINDALTRVMQLVDDADAQSMAAASGLRFESCSWGTVVTTTPSATLVVGTQKLPVLRRFPDPLHCLPTRDVVMTVGNEAAAHLTTLSLATYLRDIFKYTSLTKSLFVVGKDERVVVRTQACLLPVDDGRATRFHVGLRSDAAAELVLLCTDDGTSAHVVRRGESALYVNDHGARRTLVASPKASTSLRIVHIPITETKTLQPDSTAPCTPFFNPFLPEGPQNRRRWPAPPSCPTLPEFGPRHPDYWPCIPHCDPAAPRYSPTTPAYTPGMSLADPAPPLYVPTTPAYVPPSTVSTTSAAYVAADTLPSPTYGLQGRIEAPLTVAPPSVALPNHIAASYVPSPAYYAIGPASVATPGVVVGAFPSLGSHTIERDGTSPIRVTVLLCHPTTDGVVSSTSMRDMAERMRSCGTLAM